MFVFWEMWKDLHSGREHLYCGGVLALRRRWNYRCAKKTDKKEFKHKSTPQVHSKGMVTFKRGHDKLYYRQHILLSNAEQLPFFFFFFLRNKHTYKKEGNEF